MLNELLLELLDLILERSLLHWILNSSTDQRDEDIIIALASVNFCWFQQIIKRRFKKKIFNWLKDFYAKTKKRSAIIRNNRCYFLETIQPNDSFIASLLSLNCITEQQRSFILLQHSKRDKNTELLFIMNFFDETKFAHFVKSLRRTKQNTVARVMENGGGVIKVEVQHCVSKHTTSMEKQLFRRKFEDLRSRTKPRSQKTDKTITELKEEGIEILNSELDRQTVVVWIWCHSQAALHYIQELYESNQLKEVLCGIAKIQPPSSEIISIDRNQFKKTVAVCPLCVNFTNTISLEDGYVCGITIFRNKIYVLCHGILYEDIGLIYVYEDRDPFLLQENIEMREIENPTDIVSCETKNCLYVSEGVGIYVWKITKELDDQYNLIKWLTIDYKIRSISMSIDGHFFAVIDSSSFMTIYGSDAELIRSIQLPKCIKNPIHAVETSIGNLTILHQVEEDGRGPSVSEWDLRWVVSELTRDGQTIIRRFTPSNETQNLKEPSYFLFDSDDRVILADTGNNRAIILDSDLKWSGVLCASTSRLEDQPDSSLFYALYYDEENKQLIVGGDLGFVAGLDINLVNIYTLSQK